MKSAPSPTTLELVRQLEADNPPAADEFLTDFADRNTIRVVKHSVVRPEKFGRSILRKVTDEVAGVRALAPAVLRLDELRAAAGLAPRHLEQFARALGGGQLVAVSFNLRTNVGIDYAADSLGKSASRPAVAEYIAVTTDSGAPAAGDTTLAAEITTGGLARAIATYAHTGAATSYTLTKAFTASATHTSVQKAGLFNASSSGTMYLESAFTAASLVSGDTLTITWTINI